MKPEDIYDQFDDDAIPIKRRARNTAKQDAAPVARAIPVAAPRKASPVSAPRSNSTAQRTVNAAQRPGGAAQNGAVRQRPTTAQKQAPVNRNAAPRAAVASRSAESSPKHAVPYSKVEAARNTRQTGAQNMNRTLPTARPVKKEDTDEVQIPVRAVRKKDKNYDFGAKKEKKVFKKFFLIYLGVMLVLSIIFLIYVHGLLVDFEASQVDNVVAAKLSDIKKAAIKGSLEKEISLDKIKEEYSPDDAELSEYQRAFALGELTYKKTRNGLSSDTETYAIYLNGFRMGEMELKTVKEDMVLAIFPVTEWEIVGCSADTFSFDFPASVTVSSGGRVVEGKPSETEGFYSYTVSSLFSENTVITDSAGNTISFNGKDPVTFANYTVKVFSTYSVYSGDNLIDPAKADIKPIPEYEYIKEYCDAVPDLATYRLCLIDNGGTITVKDASGNEVETTQNDTLIEAHELEKSDTMPAGLAGDPQPLEAAEMLSLFTSDDIGGQTHGFYRLANYLLKGSFFYDSNWEFATGIDITFTSDHTLDNPPFNSEEVSEYVKFSDECFSCRIKFNKPMHMANGVSKVDSVDSTFYFVYADDSDDGVANPHWAVVDRRGQSKQIN